MPIQEISDAEFDALSQDSAAPQEISDAEFDALPSEEISDEQLSTLPELKEFLPVEELKTQSDRGEFNALQYAAELSATPAPTSKNPAASAFDKLSSEQQQKLIEVYRHQSARGVTMEAIKRGVEQFPTLVGKAVSGAGGLGKRALDIGVSRATFGLVGDKTKVKKSIAEVGAAVESGGLETVDFARGAARKVFGPSVKELTPEEIRERFFTDLGHATQRVQASRGQGAVAKAIGLDADALRKEGIELDTEAIENMNLLADPSNYLPAVGGFKILGKLGKQIAFVRGVTKLEQAVDKVNRGISKATGAVAAAPGKTAEAVGKSLKQRAETLTKLGAAGAIGGAVVSGDPETAVKAAVGAIAAPFVFKHGGELLEQVGKQTKKVGPLAERVAEFTLRRAVKPAAAGSIVGGTMAVPLALLAEDDDAASSLIAGGMAFGALGNVTLRGAKDAGQALGGYLAEKYQTLATRPKVESLGYGNPLDEVHSRAIDELATDRPADANVINQVRETFREITLPDGRKINVEVYLLPEDVVPADVPGAKPAAGFWTGLTPEGKARIYLWKDATAVFHEPGHLIHSLIKLADPATTKALADQVNASFSEPAREAFRRAYQERLYGDPDHPMDAEQVINEIVAESFSNMLRGHSLDGLPAPFRQRIATSLGGFLEISGLYEPGIKPEGTTTTGPLVVSPGGFSPLGVGHSFSLSKLGSDFISRLGVRVPDESMAGVSIETPVAPTPSKKPLATLPIGPRKVTVEQAKEDRQLKNQPPVLSIEPGIDSRKWTEAEALIQDPVELETLRALRAAVDKPQGEVGPVRSPYFSVIEDSGQSPVERSARRMQQNIATIREELGAVPEDLREMVFKTHIPNRVIIRQRKDGTPNVNIVGTSVEKIFVNAVLASREAASAGVALPIETKNGKITKNGYRQLFDALTKYTQNQMNGYAGDGSKVTVPEGYQGDIPPVNSRYVPRPVDPRTAQFINLLQGIEPPRTTSRMDRTKRFDKTGKEITSPRNVEATKLARASGRPVLEAVNVRPVEGKRPVFRETGETIKELNPLRDEFAQKGVDFSKILHESIEELSLEHFGGSIEPVQSALRGISTPLATAGFMPKPENPRAIRAAAVRDDRSKKIFAGPTHIQAIEDTNSGLTWRDLQENYISQGFVTNEGEFLSRESAFQRAQELKQLDESKMSWVQELFYGPGTKNKQLEALDFQETRAFLPRLENPRAISRAAIRYRDGRIFEADFHGAAKLRALMEGVRGPFEEGFTTNEGEFLTRQDALRRAEEMGQQPRTDDPNVGLHTGDIGAGFMPGPGEHTAIIQKVDTSAGDEFSGFVSKAEGGMTGLAYDIGLTVRDEGGLERLGALRKKWLDESHRLIAEGRIEEALPAIMKAQFFREAYEAATDTGSATGPSGFRRLRPGVEPPLPKKASGDFMPRPEVFEEIKAGKRDGVTLNKDGSEFDPGERKLDVVTVASKDIPVSELSPEALARVLEPFSAIINKPDVRPGIFRIARKGPAGEDLVSIDVNAIVDQKFRDNTSKFAADNNLESFLDLASFETVASSGDGRARLTNPDHIAEVIDSLVRGEPVNIEAIKNPTAHAIKEAIAPLVEALKPQREGGFMPVPEEIIYRRGWLDPDGKFYTVGNLETHETFAEKFLEREGEKAKTPVEAINKFYKRGWVRFTPMGFDSAMANSMDGGKLTRSQRAALEDWAYNSKGLRKLLFDPGNRRYDVLFESEKTEAEFMPEIDRQYPRITSDESDGRMVRKGVPNTSSISASLTDYEILPGIRDIPLSEFPGLTGKHYSTQGSKRIDDLAAQIKESNEISPLIVVKDNEGLYILEGATRAEALHKLNAKSLPAMLVIDKESGSFMPGAQAAPTFYSQVEQVVEKKMPNSTTPEQVRGILSPQNGVKAEELKWLDLESFLKGKEKVSKEDLTNYIQQNAVRVEEVVKTSGKTLWTQNDLDQMERVAQETGNWGLFERAQGEFEDQQLGGNANESGNETNFAQYTLPGGENYRELLLTFPGKKIRELPDGFYWGGPVELPTYSTETGRSTPKMFRESISNREGRTVLAGESKEDLLNRASKSLVIFKSPHWEEPNVLAHVRFNERTDADGKRVLFVEEIQSDWHEKGRREGYSNKDRIKELQSEAERLIKEKNSTTDKWRFMEDSEKRSALAREFNIINRRIEEINSELTRLYSAVPDAPFRKTWHELAFKRMLRWAAENGFDRLGWTTGEMQAERYDLSKKISKVEYLAPSYDEANPRGWLKAFDLDGREVVTQNNIPPEKLPDYLGKDAADRLWKNQSNGYAELEGENLKVGGEGMKGFYDKMLVDFANNYGKKWGVRVKDTKLGLYNESEAMERAENSEAVEATVHAIDITPEMRKSVLQNGQPQFMPLVGEYKPTSPEEAKAYERFTAANRILHSSNIGGVSDDKLAAIKKEFDEALIAWRVFLPKEPKRRKQKGEGGFMPRRDDYEVVSMVIERTDQAIDKIVQDLQTGVKKQSWSTVPAARFKKIWMDYGKKGILRDEKGLDAIADKIVTNYAKLQANTLLAGHTGHDPISYIEDITNQKVPESLLEEPLTDYITDETTDPKYHPLRISDYGLDRMSPWIHKLLRADTAEEKLFAIDRILNIAHQRSDLAAWFVEGGTKTLNEVFEYVPEELKSKLADAGDTLERATEDEGRFMPRQELTEYEGYGKLPLPQQGYFYHATLPDRLPSIAERGLIPSEETNWGGQLGDQSLGKIFASETPAGAAYYGEIITRELRRTNPDVFLPLLRFKRPDEFKRDSQTEQDWFSELPVKLHMDVWTGSDWRPLTKEVAEAIATGEWNEPIGGFMPREQAPLSLADVEVESTRAKNLRSINIKPRSDKRREEKSYAE